MLSQFQHDMSMSGVTLEQYLEHSKKTVEEMRSELYQPAHTRAVTQMILDRIAEKENISADTARLDQEMAAMAERYASAPGYDAESARNYIEQILTNQAVFNWFESKSGFMSHDHDALVAAE
jgi:FKBP-type peptidyl-prolyl cis-trans isomerase (trigger factor)